MEDYRNVDREIGKLESMMPRGFFSSSKTDWKSIWGQIRVIGSAFKGTKFPTHDEHQQAWGKFQNLVEDVKRLQEAEREKWDQKKTESARLRDRIISQAQSARPSNGFADVILLIATGGLSAMIKLTLEAILGPFDERKQELLNASEALKKGWEILNQSKDSMLGRDKQEAFQALNAAKENLDREWDSYKRERQKAVESYHREREQKQKLWRSRVEENISKLEDRRDRLSTVLSRREAHLSELYSKLNDARSDDFRSRVSGWIEEEESNIRDIRDKLRNVEDWLHEARSKLNG